MMSTQDLQASLATSPWATDLRTALADGRWRSPEEIWTAWWLVRRPHPSSACEMQGRFWAVFGGYVWELAEAGLLEKRVIAGAASFRLVLAADGDQLRLGMA
jgi:hypothetical protein